MPPVHPELTSQQSTSCFLIMSRRRLPYSVGGRGKNGAAKQVENSGSTPTKPFSVPATFAVYPERKWYIACAGVSLAIGGITPNASAVRKITFLGCPARPVLLARGMKSSG